eukprot:NODE_1129_length_813_cov_0.266106.p1 type:complete len:145 gc:universal NODE_1129_length_813_cov_0.266106:546-112(-)
MSFGMSSKYDEFSLYYIEHQHQFVPPSILDTEYLNNKVIKIIKSNIVENTSDRKIHSKATKAELTEEVLKEIKKEIKKKLKQFPKPNKVTLDHTYELMIWLNALKQGSLVRVGYFYPLGSFKDNMISMDSKSFVKRMNCSFSGV